MLCGYGYRLPVVWWMGYHNYNLVYHMTIGCLANLGMTLGRYTRGQSIIFPARCECALGTMWELTMGGVLCQKCGL